MRERLPAVYIVANRRNGTLYTGVTAHLVQRIWQHREGAGGFSTRYDCKLLVWFEIHATMESAIAREKQIKAGSRAKKLALIEAENPLWVDLWPTILDGSGRNPHSRGFLKPTPPAPDRAGGGRRTRRGCWR
jgi:putative endonuclease